jgi:hypothetical protein
MKNHDNNQAQASGILPRASVNRWHWVALCLGLCTLVLLFTAQMYAQEYRGLIIGQVKDSSGAVIADAKITAKGPQQTYTATTNESGDFSIPFVQPATYQVSAEATGFKKSIHRDVVISVAQKVNLNFKMEVGAVADTVDVVSSAVAVNTGDASGGTVVGNQETQNLPLNGRQVFMLMALTPGVLFTTTSFGPAGNSGTRGWDQTNSYQINGVVNSQNQFTLNGAPISQQASTARGSWFIAPNADAVQEFKIQTSNYDATVGRSGGGTVSLVIKPGERQYHGTLFDYWRNSVLDANVYQFNQLNKPKGFHNQHQFGGTFGGPIKQDKTFFFASFEGWREVLPIPVVTTVPTGIVVNPDGSVDMSTYLNGPGINHSGGIYNPFQCAPGQTNPDGTCKTRARLSWAGKNDVIPPNLVSPIGLKILALYPQPNVPGFINNYVSTSGGRYQYNQPIVRVDHNFTDRTKMYGVFSWWSGSELRNVSGFSDPRIQTGNIDTQRSYWSQSLSLTHTFSSTLVGDVRASYGRARDFSPNGGLAAGTGKLTPQNLGITAYPIPPTTGLNLAPEINNTDPPANIIGNSVYSDTGHPPFNASFEVSPTISQLKGNHNLRYGGQYLKVIAIPCCGAGQVGNGPNGVFNFTDNFTRFNPNNANIDPAGVTGTTGAAFANIVMGLPNSGNIPYNLTIYESYPYYAGFIQDDWKIHPRLTINLGMRYDFEHSPHERHDRLNGGFCYVCVNPITNSIAFPTGNVLVDSKTNLPNAAGLTMPNPIMGGFTFMANGAQSQGFLGSGRQAYDTQYNHWQPRIGVSWAFDQNTVIRGGYGVNYGFGFELGGNTTFTQVTQYLANNPGSTTPNTYFATGNPYPFSPPLTPPAGSADGLFSSIGDGQGYDQRNRKITRVQHYSLGMQHEFPGGLVLDASYVGTYTGNIRVGTNFDALTPAQVAQCAALAASGAAFNCASQVVNPFYHAMPPDQQASSLNNAKTVSAFVLMEPFPQFNQTLFSNTEPVGFSDYNSLQVKVRKRVNAGPAWIRGLTLLSSFTWSKNMTYTTLNNNNNGQCPGCLDIVGPGSNPLTPLVPKPYYQLDANDRTLNFAFSGIYELPVGKGKPIAGGVSGWLGQVINNWALDWIFTDATGTPIQPLNTVTYNCPQNNNSYLPAHQNFSEWIYNETPSCYTPLGGNTWIPRPIVTRQNTLRNPWAPQATFALQKQIDIGESRKLQFRAEAFNAFNTPIFGGPSTANPNVPVTVNTTIPGIQPGAPGYCSGYGCVGSTQQNFPRQLQLSLKIIF